MKKKENLWQLLQRLDEEAGQFNFHLYEANRYFDKAAETTRRLLLKQEKDLHATITKVRQALKKFKPEKENKNKNQT